jgi:hypothetical protein
VGYDLHITRRKDWSQTATDITAEEWLAHIKRDPELLLFPENGPYFAMWNGKSDHPDPWLDWHKGCIFTKNPDPALIDKMVAIAVELQAQVQGDDGEIYRSGHEPPIYPKQSIVDRLRNWWRALRPATRIKELIPPFQVGERVLDAFHKETTVTEIDSKSNHGLGKVKVRYDDGREMSFMLAASGLSPVLDKEKE